MILYISKILYLYTESFIYVQIKTKATFEISEGKSGPGQCWLERGPVPWNIVGSIPREGKVSSWIPCWEAYERQPIDVSLFHWYFSCFLSPSPPFLSLPLYLYFPFFSKDYIIYVLFCTFFSLTNISYKLVHSIQLHYKNFWYICNFELSCKCNFLMILSFKQKFLG